MHTDKNQYPPDLSLNAVPELQRVAAELRERLSTGCALPAAERAQIKAMLAMVQGQLKQQGAAGQAEP